MFLREELGEGNGNPLQHSCLENPMDGGAWWAAVHGVAKSQARLSNFTFTFHFHALEKEMATHSSGTAEMLLLLLLLSHFSRVRLCATPQTAARQASPSLGFSRQEHWSGLPLPSLMI